MNPSEPARLPIFKTRGPLDPVSDSAICAPRPELEQMLRAVQAPTVDAYLAILSSRQTGKTTLLYQLRARLRPRGYGIALVDLAGVHDQPEDQLYRFVASQIRSELAPNLPRRADKRDLPPPTSPLEFRRFLLDLARQVDTPRLVLLLDEVEAVPEKFSDAFFGTFRNVFSSRRKEDEAAFEKYLVVLCGARELHRLTSGSNSPLNIAERIYLQDLSLEGVRMLAANFPRAGVAAPNETAEWLYEQARGHPYLTQKLCAVIEQQQPATVTRETVQHAAGEILRTDDHLAKMIIQIDAEPTARETLQQIIAGQTVQFSRLKPTVARLELLGAIRDEGQCVVRNALYHAAFEAHFNPPPAAKPAPSPARWLRPLVLLIALLVFLLNAPLLYVYANDIVLAPRAVNEVFAPAGLGARAVIRYNRVLRANDTTPTTITVEIEQASAPILVTFRANDADIVREGEARRRFDPPAHRERFGFTLNASGVSYNPLQPATPQRRIDLIFEPQTAGSPRETYAADFRVDAYSAAIVSAALAFASFVAFLAGLWANMQRVREALGLLARFAKPTT